MIGAFLFERRFFFVPSQRYFGGDVASAEQRPLDDNVATTDPERIKPAAAHARSVSRDGAVGYRHISISRNPTAIVVRCVARNCAVGYRHIADDLTILLANWDQMVSAAKGNLVDPLNTKINFQDLTFLLAAWTGPGGAASPQAAATEATVHHTPTTDSHTTTTARFDQLTRRAHTPSRRIDRSTKLSSHDSRLRRLQAGAVDRAMGEELVDGVQRRGMTFARRIRRRQ